MGFTGSSEGKEYSCNAGDLGLMPGSGRSPGGARGSPLQYSCLRIPMDRGAWRAAVCRVAESDTTEQLGAAQRGSLRSHSPESCRGGCPRPCSRQPAGCVSPPPPHQPWSLLLFLFFLRWLSFGEHLSEPLPVAYRCPRSSHPLASVRPWLWLRASVPPRRLCCRARP